MKMKKKDRSEYEKWVSHRNNTKERTNYSIRRMDLLIISISGAGIYIIFETIREFKTGSITMENKSVLLWSGIVFLLCIVSNFISQLTGYHANNNEERYIDFELRRIEGKEYDGCEQKFVDKKVEKFNLATSILNTASIILMLIGLLLLAIFNYLLF